MASDKDAGARAAQQSRAAAIRRKRDRYNAPGTPEEPVTPAAPDSADAGAAPAADRTPAKPNYSAWIDKKMREPG
jgi:hypothetical protein